MRALSFLLVFCIATAHAQPSLSVAADRHASPSPEADSGFYVEPFTADFGLNIPTGLALSSSGTVYIAEKDGAVRLVRADGTVQLAPVVDLRDEVYADGDRGLTGIALHPAFPATPYLYLFYSVDDLPGPTPPSRSRGYSRLTRYSLDVSGEAVVEGSRFVLLGATPEDGVVSCYNSHSAGTLRFGHDGTLFASHGDGASWAHVDVGGLYPECFGAGLLDPALDVGAFRSQTVLSMAGKVLRLDPETGEGLPDNPFWTGDGRDRASRVWALGLRNPFRFAMMPPVPGDSGPGALLVGDVGWGIYEELNVVRSGENFGWPCFEGPILDVGYAASEPKGFDCSGPFEGTLATPRAYFHHFAPNASAPAGRVASSITGGAFYGQGEYPERFEGMLFFADYSVGWIVAARVGEAGLEGTETVLDDAGAIVDLAYDAASGSLLAVDIGRGRLVRLRHTGGGAVPPVAQASVSAPYGELLHTVTLSGEGSFDPAGGPLTYEWAFGTGDGADGEVVETTYYSVGNFLATLTVTNDAGLSAQAVVPVTVGESLPVVEILAPTEPTVRPDGQIELALQALDARGESLETFWEIDLVHNAHVHPSFFTLDAASGSILTVPHSTTGETAYYVARAVVTDEEGLRVEKAVTLRDYAPDALDLGAVADLEPEPDGVTVRFPQPFVVGRVKLPNDGSGISDLDVSVTSDGETSEARYSHVLNEGEYTQILFALDSVDVLRVTGASAPIDSLGVFARVPLDAPLPEAWEAGDAGDVVFERPGRTLQQDGAFTLFGRGRFDADGYHVARRVLTGDGLLVARLDAVEGMPDAAAGLVLRTGLGAADVGVGVGVRADGELLALNWTGAETEFSASGIVSSPTWLRVVREGEVVAADISSDSLAWTRVSVRQITAGTPVVVGMAIAGGDRFGAAWFGEVSLQTEFQSTLPPTAFRVVALYPNPGAGTATVEVGVVDGGVYGGEVVDALGRTVLALPNQSAAFAETLHFEVPREGLPQGIYYVRVRHAETGETRVGRMVVLR